MMLQRLVQRLTFLLLLAHFPAQLSYPSPAPTSPASSPLPSARLLTASMEHAPGVPPSPQYPSPQTLGRTPVCHCPCRLPPPRLPPVRAHTPLVSMRDSTCNMSSRKRAEGSAKERTSDLH
ncbi:hypothetical protein ABPG75_013016 [Micractinium tetrahymenae]